MCLVASSRSPFHKWEDGGWSDSLSSFPAHAGSCLRNSKVFFYLQNLLIPNIAQTVREKQCPEISSVPHSWRFGRNHLRKPSKGSWWASRMLSQVGPSLTTAGGTVTVGGLAGGWVAYVALVNKSLKLLLQRQMLTRAQWTEQACALMWLGMRRNAEKGTKSSWPTVSTFSQSSHSRRRSCSLGCRCILVGKVSETEIWFEVILATRRSGRTEWSEPPWKEHLGH